MGLDGHSQHCLLSLSLKPETVDICHLGTWVLLHNSTWVPRYLSQDKVTRCDRSNPTIVGHQYTGSLLQDSAGLLTINGFALPAKLAEKRKLIEEFAHNDVKKVSMIYFTISFILYTCVLFLSDLLVYVCLSLSLSELQQS